MNERQYYREHAECYYKIQLEEGVRLFKARRFAEVEFIRAELHTVNMYNYVINMIDVDEFNGLECFVNDMLGGKKDVGIRYERN